MGLLFPLLSWAPEHLQGFPSGSQDAPSVCIVVRVYVSVTHGWGQVSAMLLLNAACDPMVNSFSGGPPTPHCSSAVCYDSSPDPEGSLIWS